MIFTDWLSAAAFCHFMFILSALPPLSSAYICQSPDAHLIQRVAGYTAAAGVFYLLAGGLWSDNRADGRPASCAMLAGLWHFVKYD